MFSLKRKIVGKLISLNLKFKSHLLSNTFEKESRDNLNKKINALEKLPKWSFLPSNKVTRKRIKWFIVQQYNFDAARIYFWISNSNTLFFKFHNLRPIIYNPNICPK